MVSLTHLLSCFFLISDLYETSALNIDEIAFLLLKHFPSLYLVSVYVQNDGYWNKNINHEGVVHVTSTCLILEIERLCGDIIL